MINGHETTHLLDYLRAVRQRWRSVVLVVVLTTGVALAISLSGEQQYDASVELLLRGQEPVNTLLDPNAGGQSNDPERELNTEVQLIKVAANAHAVRRQLNLNRSADDLLAQIKTETSSTSNIVTLTVRDPDPVLATRIANAFATTYIQFRLNSTRGRYREAAELAQQQLRALTPSDRGTIQGRELQARQRELEIAAALQTGGAEIVRRASVPTSASRPRPKLSAGLGLVLGLILGLSASLLLNLVDRRFKDEQEIEAFFGLPVLAAIPRPARRGLELDDPAQREAYGLLAANLRLSATGQAGKVIMVTSPSPAEGKTSVTIGIARAVARLGMTVIAIEADLRRPAFSRYVHVASHGLIGVLGGSPLERELVWLETSNLQPVNIDDGYSVIGLLPAGEVSANPQRMLSDPRMELILKVASATVDVVLIDTAPLGTVNDAATLARVVDGVALVARLNQTTKDAGRRASRSLDNLGCDVLGVVVTDAAVGEDVYYSAAPPTQRVSERSRSRVWGAG